MKKTLIYLISLGLLFGPATHAFADAAEGDVILILGENLSPAQKESMMKELDAPAESLEVMVTNAEEHKYLGEYIPKAQIGSKALSSAKITIAKKDSGLVVASNNINWVSNEMYTNALITAGVKDASIYITAPFSVSGTAALTGLIKAYEVSTGEVIPEEQKQVANEEMVKTAQLGDEIGKEETNALMTRIKEEIGKQKPETEEEMSTLIQGVAEELGLTIPETYLNGLVDLFMKMKDINIDWDAVGEQLSVAKEKFTNFMESEEAQGLMEKAKEFFTTVFDAIKGWFSTETTTE